MIPQKLKICRRCKKKKKLFSNKMCLECCRIVNPPKPLKKSRVKPISTTQKKRNEKYAEKRKIYLEEKKLCEARLDGCTVESTEIHHPRGRDGDNLFGPFLAVCRNCHQFIEANPEEAKRLGFSETRLKKEEE